MSFFRKTAASLSLMTLAFAVQCSAFAAPVVKQYQVRSWSTSDGVQNTVAAVGGLTYGGTLDSSDNLAGTDIVVAGTWSNDFSSWVAAGGVFVWHDWGQGATALPGMAGAYTAGYNGSDINIIDGASAIVQGPMGTLQNTTLDNGNSSAHGAWAAASLTSTDALVHDIHAILSSTDSTSVVMFEMGYGLGHILYANIPLEAYTDSDPLVTGSQPAGLRMYAGNELAYAGALSAASRGEVPEPSSALLALLALGAAGAVRRKVRQA